MLVMSTLIRFAAMIRNLGHADLRVQVKDVNFLWKDHIMSGSDDGRLFIWDKHTAEVVNILQGDQSVVNVEQVSVPCSEQNC